MANLNRGTTGDTNVDVLLPGAFGGTGKQTIDNADLLPRDYNRDWLAIFSLPPRPALIGTDFAAGVFAGAWIFNGFLLVSHAFSPLAGMLFALAVVAPLAMTAQWVFNNGTNWEKAGVVYRWLSLMVGVMLFVL